MSDTAPQATAAALPPADPRGPDRASGAPLPERPSEPAAAQEAAVSPAPAANAAAPAANPAGAAPAGAPAMPMTILQGYTIWQAMPFFVGAILIGLAAGLGQGFVAANIPQMAGDLHVSTTDASWLMVAYMIPRSTLPLILTKVRTQYGLRVFSQVAIVMFVLVSLFGVTATDFRSALVYMALAGCASAPLSTLTFMYMLEPFGIAGKMKFGMPLVMVVMMSGPNLARVISPSLIGDGGLEGIHIATLGLAVMSFAVIWFLRLVEQPTEKVLQTGDFVSFGFITLSFSCLTTAAVMGPTYWWTATPFIGWMLAIAVAAFAIAVLIEVNRKLPLIDFRWLASPSMLIFSTALILFRLLLSEQSAGAPRMFQVLGLGPSQLVTLFQVICMASVAGGLACVAWIKPTRIPLFHGAALILIAAGCYMDSFSTVDTRPEQFLISQALIAFAGMLFMPPAMLMGVGSAMRKGPSYLISFIVVFIATQSLGGVLGSGLFTTFINHRQAFHLATLTEQLTPTDPATQSFIAGTTAQLARVNPDLGADRSQAVTQLLTSANQQATVMAYNDAYYFTFLVALAALFCLALHVMHIILSQKLAPQPSQPVRQ